VEKPTPIVRSSEQVRKPTERYSPPDFGSAFVLSTTDKDPKSFKEEVYLIESKTGRMPWLKK
jgi:hypothetical protein